MNTPSLDDIKMDVEALYKEETITDQKVGSIRVMTPILSSGEIDTSRKITYIGQTQVMTPAGALPLQFELDASDLTEAIEQFSAGAQKAIEQTMEEIKEMRRQQASSIVVPGQDPMAGRSKIQMP